MSWDEEQRSDSIQFATLHPDGTLTNQRSVKRSVIAGCPQLIMVPEHYREDGSCRCDEGYYDVATGAWVEDKEETCEDRGYECCDITPPGEDPDAGWYARHMNAWRLATIWADEDE